MGGPSCLLVLSHFSGRPDRQKLVNQIRKRPISGFRSERGWECLNELEDGVKEVGSWSGQTRRANPGNPSGLDRVRDEIRGNFAPGHRRHLARFNWANVLLPETSFTFWKRGTLQHTSSGTRDTARVKSSTLASSMQCPEG